MIDYDLLIPSVAARAQSGGFGAVRATVARKRATVARKRAAVVRKRASVARKRATVARHMADGGRACLIHFQSTKMCSLARPGPTREGERC